MVLHIGVLSVLKNSGSHISILNPVISQDGRCKISVKIHLCKALRVLLRDLVIALPECFLLRIGKTADPVPENLRLFHKTGDLFAGKSIRVHNHLFGGRNNDPQFLCLLSVTSRCHCPASFSLYTCCPDSKAPAARFRNTRAVRFRNGISFYQNLTRKGIF